MAKRRFGFDLLRDQLVERLDANLALYEAERLIGDTPIEQLFVAALVMAPIAEQREFSGVITVDDVGAAERVRNEHNKNCLILENQVQLDNWRVDFVISAWTDGTVWTPGVGRQDGKPRWRKLIIECDGHDYHERTKEQAAKDRSRDRSVTGFGCEIFRFTGSELWRNPLGCADQVYEWAARGVE